MFRKILAKIASGTAAAVVATSANGIGVTYQALYEAERTDDSGKRATWAGSLSGLWTDDQGFLREDGNHNGQLDDYITDPVIQFAFQASGQQTIVTRFVSSDPTTFTPTTSVTVDINSLNTIWNARALLWDPALNTDTQRDYSTPFSTANGRYIFTWVDDNHDGVVDDGEVRPLLWDTSGTSDINSSNYRFLNTDSTTEAQNIVSWIRGKEIGGLRNRTVDYDTTAPLMNRVTRLGDIVNSTPLVVSTPAESYDLLYNDTSYANFRNTYRNRRQMVYVGANDGMLHAFNGGFYNTSCKRFELQPTDAVCTPTTPNATGTISVAATAHPLGAEVWAYVPGNELPHLRWLTDPNYKHTYYVDGSPIAYDAKVFASDATHTDGWGTLLVVPFRLGGGTITVDTSTNGTPANQTSESAYVVLDITNPEIAPTVLAEITLPGTRTTSIPAVVAVRDVTSGTPNKFFVAIGSGPTDPKRVASSAPLKVTVYDSATLAAATHSVTPVRVFDLSATSDKANKSLAGDLIASDFNLDGLAESLYFGSVHDNGSDNFGGHFWKIAVNGNQNVATWTPSLMLDMTDGTVAPDGLPVTIRPTLARNNRGAPMVFFGTGRLYDSNDKATSKQQRIFGLVDTSLLVAGDPQFGTADAMGNLINVTNIGVFNSVGHAVNGIAGSGLDSSSVTNFEALESAFDKAGVAGWFLNLSTFGTNPSERVVSSQTLLGGILLTTTYIPGTSICTGLGTAALFGLNYATGTGNPDVGLFGSTNGKVNTSLDLGQGLPAPPSLHVGNTTDSNGQKKVTACVQTSTGAIVCKDVATLNSVTSGEASWREPVGK